MTQEKFEEYLNVMKNGGMPVIIGFQITYNQFLQFAEYLSIFIERIGWKYYKNYLDIWYSKITDKQNIHIR